MECAALAHQSVGHFLSWIGMPRLEAVQRMFEYFNVNSIDGSESA